MSKINLVTDEGEFIVDVVSNEVSQVKVVQVEGDLKERIIKRLTMTAKMDAVASVNPITRIATLEERLTAIESRLEPVKHEARNCGNCDHGDNDEE